MDTATWIYSVKTPWTDTTGHNTLQSDKLSNLNKISKTMKSGLTLGNTVKDNYGMYPRSMEETVTGQHLTNGWRITKSISTIS